MTRLGARPAVLLSAAGSAGEFAGLVADEDAVDDGADGVLFVGVEVGDGLDAELPVVGGVFVGIEDELIGVGVEREGESADDVEGGLRGAESAWV